MMPRGFAQCAGRQVYLDITVKVMEKWRKNEKMLEQHGY